MFLEMSITRYLHNRRKDAQLCLGLILWDVFINEEDRGMTAAD